MSIAGITGKSAYRSISELADNTNREYSALSSQSQDAEQKIAALLNERETCYQRLATFHLPALEAEKIKGTLREMQADIQRIYQEKLTKRKEIDSAMQATGQTKADLETALVAISGKLEQKSKDRDALQQAIGKELGAHPEYTAIKKKAEEAVAGYEKHKTHAETFKQKAPEVTSKFLAVPQFRYLLEREYGTVAHKGLAITQKMDLLLVASVIQYSDMKKGYDSLCKAPALLDERLVEEQTQINALAEEIKMIEKTIAEKYKLPELLKEGNNLNKEKKELSGKIQQLAVAYQEQAGKAHALERTNDSYYQKAVDKLRDFLKGETLEDLKQRAKKTASAEDDALVSQLEKIECDVASLRQQMQGIQTEKESLRKKLDGLEEIRGYCRQDNERVHYREGFDANALFTGYLLGHMTASEVNHQLSEYRYYPPSRRQRTSYTTSRYAEEDDDSGTLTGGGLARRSDDSSSNWSNTTSGSSRSWDSDGSGSSGWSDSDSSSSSSYSDTDSSSPSDSYSDSDSG